MQSSTVLAFRAFVVLTCLVLVPLAALFGTPLADWVVQALGAHTHAPPAAGTGSLPLVSDAIENAPPFQGNTVLGATPSDDAQTATNALLTAPSPNTASAPSAVQSPNSAGHAPPFVAPPAASSNAHFPGSFEAHAAGQSASSNQAPYALGSAWPAQPGFASQPFAAAEMPAAYQFPSGTTAAPPATTAVSPFGHAQAQLPQAAALGAAPPHDLVAQQVVPAGFNAPTYPTTGFPEAAPLDHASPGGAQSSVSASAPSVAVAPGIAPPASGQGANERFAQVQERLRALGATYYLLETWGHDGTLFRFHCKMAVAEDPNYTRQFEATDTDALRAMEWVLDQVVRWREGS